MPYGTIADVSGRLPRGAASVGFSSTTRPSSTDVTNWIAQISSRIDGNIRAAGFDPATLSADGTNQVLFAVTSYVAGIVERTWAGASGGGGNPTDHGRDLFAPLLDLLKLLREQPSDCAVMLGLTIPSINLATKTNTSSLRSFHTDAPDALDPSITPDPIFKIGGKF